MPPVGIDVGVLLAGVLVVLRAFQLDRALRADVDEFGREPHLLGDVVGPVVQTVARYQHQIGVGSAAEIRGPRLVVVRVGVGLQELDDLDLLAADRSREVGHLGGGRDDPQGVTGGARGAPAAPDGPSVSAAAATVVAAARPVRARPRERSSRTRTASRKTHPLRTAIVAPGGAFVSTESHNPPTPTKATTTTVVICQTSMRLHSSRVAAAGTTMSAVASNAPTALRTLTATSATSPSRTTSGRIERAPSVRAVCASKPTTSQRVPRTTVASSTTMLAPPANTRSPESMTSRLPKSSGLDTGGDANTSLARMTPGDRAPTSTIAVVRRPVAGAFAPAERPDPKCDEQSGPRGAERGGEPEPVREDQPGKGRGADRVGVERQPAQDDPRPDQPSADREQQDLPDTALEERKGEGVEQRAGL